MNYRSHAECEYYIHIQKEANKIYHQMEEIKNIENKLFALIEKGRFDWEYELLKHEYATFNLQTT